MKEINIKNFNEKIYYDKCDNGLEIYMWVNEKVSSFYATLNVRYGSKDLVFTTKEKKTPVKVPPGTAHFLEHLKFYLPGGKTAHEKFASLGSSINAGTTFDFTNYEVYASSKFKENIENLLDYVQTSYFTKELVKTEKGIIIEEVKMYDDNPYDELNCELYRCLFKHDNRKSRIIGELQDVKAIEIDDIENVYNAFYHPKNMFLIITGNFNPKEAAAIVKENQSKKEFPKYLEPELVGKKEPIKVVKNISELYQNIEIPKVKMTFKMSRRIFKDIDDLDLKVYLQLIMQANFGATSDLKEELTKNDLISSSISNSATVRNEYVLLNLAVTTKYPKEVAKIFKETIDNLSISEVLIKRKRKSNIANVIMRYDDIEFINMDIQNDILNYGGIVDNIHERLNKINLKTANKILKTIKTENYVTVIAYPNKAENAEENVETKE